MIRFPRSLACVMVLVLTGVAAAQSLPARFVKVSQDGTPIPDVNKPNPADPNDGTCWLAGAANVLAAAGYGSGPDAQQRALNIYNQMRIDWGLGGGAPDHAISHWLAHYGRNPDHPEFNLNVDYTDITAAYRTLGQADYDFLRQELYDCQYVTVQFDSPAHCMTMVGWDHTVTPNLSIWHDSDVNTVPPGDDHYQNAFSPSPQWNLLQPGTQNAYVSSANGYSVFCSGLDKPEDAMLNYDVAWAPGPNGPAARYAGAQNGLFLTPDADPTLGWGQTPYQHVDPVTGQTTNYETFRIDNEFDPLRQKEVSLLIDFYDRNSNYINEDIKLRYLDEFGMEVVASPDAAVLSADDGQLLLTWSLDIQPAWEEILFPNLLDYQMLEGRVCNWDVATICVPEPGTIGLLLLAAAALRRRKWQALG